MKTIFYHINPVFTGPDNAAVGTVENWPGNVGYPNGLPVKVDGKWWRIVRLDFVADGVAYVLVVKLDAPQWAVDIMEETAKELAK